MICCPEHWHQHVVHEQFVVWLPRHICRAEGELGLSIPALSARPVMMASGSPSTRRRPSKTWMLSTVVVMVTNSRPVEQTFKTKTNTKSKFKGEVRSLSIPSLGVHNVSCMPQTVAGDSSRLQSVGRQNFAQDSHDQAKGESSLLFSIGSMWHVLDMLQIRVSRWALRDLSRQMTPKRERKPVKNRSPSTTCTEHGSQGEL